MQWYCTQDLLTGSSVSFHCEQTENFLLFSLHQLLISSTYSLLFPKETLLVHKDLMEGNGLNELVAALQSAGIDYFLESSEQPKLLSMYSPSSSEMKNESANFSSCY